MNEHTHIARPLTESEEQASYRDTLSFHGETKRRDKRFVMLGYILGGVGVFCLTASAVGWDIILPLKTTEVRWVKVGENPSGEINYGVKTEDAASLFGEAEARHYMQQYVEVRDGYVPELDRRHWDIVLTMSSPDVAAEYLAWRKSDLSPVSRLASAGQVQVSRFSFTPHGKGKNDTYEYAVSFDRQEIRGENIGPKKRWHTTIDFQWHPTMMQSLQQQTDNAGGMVVTAYNPPEME